MRPSLVVRPKFREGETDLTSAAIRSSKLTGFIFTTLLHLIKGHRDVPCILEGIQTRTTGVGGRVGRSGLGNRGVRVDEESVHLIRHRAMLLLSDEHV